MACCNLAAFFGHIVAVTKNRILISGLLGAAALAAAGIGYLRSIDFDRFRPALVDELRAATGRDVAIDGPVRLALWPVPHFTMTGVAIANAPWGTRPALAQIERVDARIALRPLLKGELRIARLRLVRPDLWLETDPFGKVNWVLAGGAGPALLDAAERHGSPDTPAGSLLGALAVGRVDMAGGRVTYRDGATGDITVVTVSSASVEGDGQRTPLKLAFSGDWNALPLTLSGAVGPFNAIAFDEGPASAVRFDLESAGVRLSVGGTVGNPRSGPGATLHIAGKAPALDKLGAVLGLALPPAAAASLDTDLRYRKGLLTLDDVRIALGEQSASGTLKVDFTQPRPAFAADLHAPEVDLSGLAGGSAAAGPAMIQALADSGFLALIDGKADMTIDTLRAGPLALRDTEAHLTVKDGSLVIAPLRGQSAGGPIEARFGIDGRSVPARLSLSVKAPTLAIGAALQQLDAVEAFGGVVSFAANLTTVAGPPEKMLAGLDGEALLAMGEGRLTLEPYRTPFAVSTAGLGGLAGLLATEGRRDVGIECLAGRVTVAAGVARSDGFVLVSEDARVKGEGSVDLNAGRVALRFTPQARNGALLVGQPVALSGSLRAPVLTVEPAAAHAVSMSDMALYPMRRLFASLGANAGANACLRSLPPAPHKRAHLNGRPIAQRPQSEVQEAGIPATRPLTAPLAGGPVE